MNLRTLASRISNVFFGHIDRERDRYGRSVLLLNKKLEDAELEFNDAIALAKSNLEKFEKATKLAANLKEKLDFNENLFRDINYQIARGSLKIQVRTNASNLFYRDVSASIDRLYSSGPDCYVLTVRPRTYSQTITAHVLGLGGIPLMHEETRVEVLKQIAAEYAEATAKDVNEQLLGCFASMFGRKPAAEAK